MENQGNRGNQTHEKGLALQSQFSLLNSYLKSIDEEDYESSNSARATFTQALTPFQSRSDNCPITTKLAERGSVTMKLRKTDATLNPEAYLS